MQIEHISITDFKGIETFQMTPGKVNILIGANGTGKTSILEAIRYGITGGAPAAPIAGGKSKAVVELTFPDIGTLTRTISMGRNEVRLNRKTTTQKSIHELLEKQTGASSATAELLTSAEVLSNLSSGELSAYFMENNLLKVKVTLDTLLGFCNLSEAAEALLKEQVSGDTADMGDVDRIWNDSKSRRKYLKQELKEAEIHAKTAVTKVEESAEEIEQMFQKLIAHQAELQAQKKTYDTICRQREQAFTEIRQKEKQLGERVAEPDEGKLSQWEKEMDHTAEEIQNLKSIIATMQMNGNHMAKILKELSVSTCPISPKLTCATDKSSIKAELTEEIDRMKAEYDKQKQRLKSLEEKQKDLREQKRRLELSIKQYQAQKLLSEQIAYLRSHMPKEPDKPSETQLDELSRQVEELNQKRAAIIQNMKTEEYKEIFQAKTKEVHAWEELVRELDPRKGIRQRILEKSLKPLEDYFNMGIQHILPKYKIRLDCSDGFAIKLIDGEKVYDASKSGSSGERARIWFILMDLINALSSYRILVFDHTDGMDAEALVNFLEMVRSQNLQNRYDHIFISMIDYVEVNEYLKQKSGFQVIHMQTEDAEETAA